PASATFHSHLGPKPTWATQLEHWIADNPEFIDIREFLVVAGEPRASEVNAPPSGFVYLARHGKTSEYKIGKSDDVNRRMGELDSPLPQGADMIHKIPTSEPYAAEIYWHKVFDDKRIRPKKEWFRLSASEVRRIKACKSM